MAKSLTDIEYERARLLAAAAALESGADRRLPPEIAARIWALRRGAVALPPPTRAELKRDRAIADSVSKAAWFETKQLGREARGHWQQARAAPLTAAWLHWSGHAVVAEDRTRQAFRRWHDARRTIAYLCDRLASANRDAA